MHDPSIVAKATNGTEVAFFLQDLDGGGAERAIVALAGAIAERGYAVDLVVGDANSDFRSEISADVHVHDFRTRSPVLILLRMIAYLHQRNPRVVMSALDLPNIVLVIAAHLARYKGRTVVSQRAVVEASQRELAPVRKILTRLLQRICFRQADALISNSHAAATNVRAFGVPAERIVMIHNALDIERITRLSREELARDSVPKNSQALIVSVGSLSKRKDVETLVRAFAAVLNQRAAHLLIIGKGDQEARLARLIVELGMQANVQLLGFDANPYKWIAAAKVLVSSSTGEGFPNVIAEALALGRSIVATDCPGDTAIVLEHGKWGRLVPVGDVARMADAIVAALDDPNPTNGRLRAADFAPAQITSAYLRVLLPDGRPYKDAPAGAK